MSNEALQDLVGRIERLERENRWWRVLSCVGGVALVALGVVAFSAWAQGGVQDEIRARQIVLVDRKQWRDRIVLATEADGSPVMRLVGSDSGVHATLGLGGDNVPRLSLSQPGGLVALGPDGLRVDGESARVALGARGLELEGVGAPAAAAIYRSTGAQFRSGEGSIALAVEGDGPRLEVRDAADKPKVTLAAGLDGDLNLSFYEKDGRLRTTLGHLELPGPRPGGRRAGIFLAWFDASGKVVWKAP
jgi:hypothetical protein